jgi:predicted ATPase
MEITILLGFNNSGKSTWMKEQKPDVWIKGVKNKFLLSDKENCLVAFENPECGLHPTLHADLVTLIIANAIRKNQNTIIETHSEVMLTRIRRLIACGNLDASNVNVYWFDGGIRIQ